MKLQLEATVGAVVLKLLAASGEVVGVGVLKMLGNEASEICGIVEPRVTGR